jgi:predicted dehydrogenase
MNRSTRRTFLKSTLATVSVPYLVPAEALGANGATAPSNKITVGALGVGDQGTRDMREFLNHEDVRITAICDVNKRNAAAARKIVADAYGKPDVKVYSDFREMNANPGIDAILMVLPVHWHSIPSLDAILHGKHIYHEKPMALSFEEARRVRAAVRKKGVVFQFGTQQRSDQYFRWACELALNGRLGKLKEIEVSVPGGRQTELLPEQPVPNYVNWDRWVGPAAMTPFNEQTLIRDWHENITNFSLGMISCWGIHHLDIAQWGNGTDATGPATVEASGEFPKGGTCNAILGWKVRFEYTDAARITFVNIGRGPESGVKFIGESGWVHVDRGSIRAGNDQLLRDPQNKSGQMSIKLPVSRDHCGNFLDAVRKGHRAICDIETAVRSDTLCQIASIAVKLGRKLRWDPTTEQFPNDQEANRLLAPRTLRGPWTLPTVWNVRKK